ncbi:MAG: PKD domain-containing protein [bacterium]|nr:PKD domain-containing protein [bacterium]
MVSAQTIADLQAQITALLEQVQKLQVLLGQPQKAEGWCHTFNTNLSIGSGSDEVAHLIVALRKEKFDVGDTDFYDETIASAVTGFQEKYRSEILAPAGLKNGTGYVGGRTRAKLNTLYNCGVAERVPVQKPAVYQRQSPVFQPEAAVQETSPSQPTSQFGYPAPEAVLLPSADIAVQQSQGWIAQKITCFFEGSVSQQLCSTVNKDGKKFVLFGAGNTTAVGTAFGFPGEMLTWQSSCGGLTYSTVGQSEQVTFSCDTAKPQPSITLLSPNGGELWQAGKSYVVSWRNSGFHKWIGAHLKRAGRGPMLLNGEDSLPIGTFKDTDNFMFTVPREVLSGDDYLIKIINFDDVSHGVDEAVDFSDAPFSISNPSPTQPGVAYPAEKEVIEITCDRASCNKEPFITGIDGPTSLMVGESGIWTIKASDPEGGCLYYYVMDWGDKSNGEEILGMTNGVCLQGVTFTHTYMQSGYYKVLFQVNDPSGRITQSVQEIIVK